MKRALAVLVLLGCRGAANEQAVCEHIAKLCSAEPTSQELSECAGWMSSVKAQIGDDYDRFVTCSREATSCLEAAGCGGGALANVADRATLAFERGFDRMRHPPASHEDARKAAATPAQDETYVRLVEAVAQVCACKDLRCAEAATNRYGEWAARNAPAQPTAIDEASMARFVAQTKVMTDCMTKLAMGASPPAPPEPAPP